MTRRLLTDLQGVYKLNIVEGQQGGKLVVEGKIGHCDIATANGRVYPRSVMEREINRLKPRIEQASVYSVVDHPGDGKTRLKEAGAIVRDLWIENSGEVRGRFEVVEEAPAGQTLAAFLRRGASVGMSSRGMGSTVTGPNGNDVVGEDFKLNTWDFVSDPACHDAYPAIVSEDEEQKITENHLRARFPKLVDQIEARAASLAQITLAEDVSERVTGEVEQNAEEAIKLAAPKIREEMKAEVYEECRKELREDFATKLVRAIAEMRGEVMEEVRSEMASDPELAGAKGTLKKISEMIAPWKAAPDVEKVIAERDTAASQLKRKLAESESKLKMEQEKTALLDSKGRQLAFAVYIEQRLSGRPDTDSIRKMIGKTEEVRSVADLQAKVNSAISEADKTFQAAEQKVEAEFAKAKEDAEKRANQAQQYAQEAEERVAAILRRETKLRESVDQRVNEIESKLKSLLDEKISNETALAEAKIKLAEQAQKITKLAEQNDKTRHTVAVANYARERTVGHKAANSIVEDAMAGKLNSRTAVDKAATKLEEGAHEPGGVAERIRRALSHGRESFTEDERMVAEQHEAAYSGDNGEAAADLAEIGTSLTEQSNLARGPRQTPGVG